MTYWSELNGLPLASGRVTVPRYGVWSATVELAAEDELPIQGTPAILEIGGRTFIGRIARVSSTQGSAFVTVVGGGNGWGRRAPERAYHSDTGVRSSVIAERLAASVGETLVGGGAFRRESVGDSYVQPAGVATQTMNGLAEFWGVREDGRTYAGRRITTALPSSIVLLEHDTANRTVHVDATDFALLAPTYFIANHEQFGSLDFDAYTIAWNGDTHSVTFGVGDGTARKGSRLGDALKQLVNPSPDDSRLFGLYEYEVVSMSGARVDLKTTDPTEGVPNLVAVQEWFGPGIFATLKPGALVGVMFRNGRRDKAAIVTARSSDDVELLRLGGEGQPGATVGCLVEVSLPPSIPVTGTVDGLVFAGAIVPVPPLKAIGVIIDGSKKVSLAR